MVWLTKPLNLVVTTASTSLTAFILLAVVACQHNQVDSPKTTTVKLESTPVSKVESIPVAVTKIETPQQVQATSTSVEQILSDLNTQTATDGTRISAKKTGDGIRINLPEDILFDFDKDRIRPSAKPTLVKVNQLLEQYNNAPVAIYGHTDSKGTDAYNQSLSNRRAQAVKDYLVNNFSVKTSRLEAKGHGEKQPVASNSNLDGSDNPKGRQQNRRVEIIIRNQRT